MFGLCFMYVKKWQNVEGLNRDLNPGPLAPKARIIPLDHWALVEISYLNSGLVHSDSQGHLTLKHLYILTLSFTNSKIFNVEIKKASIAQWQSVGLVNQRSWVQSSLEANIFFQKKITMFKRLWPRRDSNTQPSDLESDALPLRHGVNLLANR